MISFEEAERRLRRSSELRTVVLTLKRAAIEAYERGDIPYKPILDIRSDYKYWKSLSKPMVRKPNQNEEESQDVE